MWRQLAPVLCLSRFSLGQDGRTSAPERERERRGWTRGNRRLEYAENFVESREDRRTEANTVCEPAKMWPRMELLLQTRHARVYWGVNFERNCYSGCVFRIRFDGRYFVPSEIFSFFLFFFLWGRRGREGEREEDILLPFQNLRIATERFRLAFSRF